MKPQNEADANWKIHRSFKRQQSTNNPIPWSQEFPVFPAFSYADFNLSHVGQDLREFGERIDKDFYSIKKSQAKILHIQVK